MAEARLRTPPAQMYFCFAFPIDGGVQHCMRIIQTFFLIFSVVWRPSMATTVYGFGYITRSWYTLTMGLLNTNFEYSYLLLNVELLLLMFMWWVGGVIGGCVDDSVGVGERG